jgi:hypothetical protein
LLKLLPLGEVGPNGFHAADWDGGDWVALWGALILRFGHLRIDLNLGVSLLIIESQTLIVINYYILFIIGTFPRGFFRGGKGIFFHDVNIHILSDIEVKKFLVIGASNLIQEYLDPSALDDHVQNLILEKGNVIAFF